MTPINAHDLETLTASHGLGPLHPRASRSHPPAEQTRRVPLLVPRSNTQRAAAAIGVFVFGWILGLMHIGLALFGEFEWAYKAITLLTWVGPPLTWFALRHRNLGEQTIKGYPLNTLAQLSGDLNEGWIELCVFDDDELHLAPEPEPGSSSVPQQNKELVADEDLVVVVGPAYARAKNPPTPLPGQRAASHASLAVECLHKALVSELRLLPEQVWERQSSASEDIDDDVGGHIDDAIFVIRRGQQRDIDDVCDAVLRAVKTLRKQFDLIPGEACV